MGFVGGLILNAAREAARIYIISAIVSRMIRIADEQWELISKEGTMREVFDAQSLNLSHLNPVRISYDPKDIHTEGIQVTELNIGMLSLEFQEELFYDVDGRPYFVFTAKRFNDGEPDGQNPPHELYVRLTDWIVPLWDELHVFRHGIFVSTFTFDDPHPSIMDAARNSSDPELSSFAQKVADMKFTVPPMSVVRQYKFAPNDRVYDNISNNHAIVTVVDVDLGDGTFGIEILLNNGTYRHVHENDLDFVPDPFQPHSGNVEGPSGTSIMPRVED